MLEAAGVVFATNDDPSIPGPNDLAFVEIVEVGQVAFEHHHAPPDNFVHVLAAPATRTPAEHWNRIATAFDLSAADVIAVQPRW